MGRMGRGDHHKTCFLVGLFKFAYMGKDQPTLFYSHNLNLNQLNRLRTRLDKQSGLSTGLDWLRLRQVEVEVKVEAQSTSLIEIS